MSGRQQIRDRKKGRFFMKYERAAKAARAVIRVCALMAGLSSAYSVPAGEVLKATPDHFDFGTIAEGTPAVATTSIQNIGKTPVEITNVRTN
jgi:hypothetical protein